MKVKRISRLASTVVLLIGGSILAAGPGPIEIKIDPRLDDPTFFTDAPIPFALRIAPAADGTAVSIPADWYKGVQLAYSPVAPAGTPSKWTLVSIEPTRATTPATSGAMLRLVSPSEANRATIAAATGQAPPDAQPPVVGDTAYLVAPPARAPGLAPGRYELRATVSIPVATDGNPAQAMALEDRFTFDVIPAATPAHKSRRALLLARFAEENEKDVKAAIAHMEQGMKDSGDVELNYRLASLYERNGELLKSRQAAQTYVDWARSPAAPRRGKCGGPQEIADELELYIAKLDERIQADKAKAGPGGGAKP